MSVPNQTSLEGCFSRLTGSTAWGSTVPSQGASTATRIMAASTIPPTIAVGWRRNASLKRPGATAASVRAAVAMSVADARIEVHVGEVHREVHEHVGAREDQDHALDDGIVAPQDRVHREAPDARDGEHGLGDDRAADQERDADAD